jgi:DNA-binding transcriptional ArsR family regulator
MPINSAAADYELADDVQVSSPAGLRAMAHPTRSMILDLLLERAATVSELAAAMDRPKSTIAHHVNVLVDAGMLKVVRTRRVRAIDERYYGRTARIFHVGAMAHPSDNPMTLQPSCLAEAAVEAAAAHEADELTGFLRHARIPAERAQDFWQRVVPLLHEFNQLPRAGDTMYGFAVGLYPTDHPTLPDPE